MWVITIGGTALIVTGLIINDGDHIMLGFALIGTEPLLRAHRDAGAA